MLSFHNRTWKFQPQDWGGGGEGGTLIFSYIRRLESFLWDSNIEFHYFGVFFRKMNLWEYEDFVDFLGGSSQNWNTFRGHFYAF